MTLSEMSNFCPKIQFWQNPSPQHFHEFFTKKSFWQFFSWNESCQQLKCPNPQHFHEFFFQSIYAFQVWIQLISERFIRFVRFFTDSNGSYFFPLKKQQVESFRFQQYCVKVCHVSALSRTYKCSFDNLKLLWDTREASLNWFN